jgi:hypothetical protein
MLPKKADAVYFLSTRDDQRSPPTQMMRDVPVFQNVRGRARRQSDGAEHPGNGQEQVGDHADIVEVWRRDEHEWCVKGG